MRWYLYHINQDLSAKIVTSYKFLINLEVLPIEITLCKRKILLLGFNRPPSYSENEFLFHLENVLSHYTTTYENITLIEDFNMNPVKYNIRDLKHFDQKTFNSYLESKMVDCPNSFEKFLQIFQDTVEVLSPLKKNIFRCNNKTFMTKSLDDPPQAAR